MNKDSVNLCVPIINIDSEGKNLICCYKTLELKLGKTCPAFYHKPYVINIISFVNEDMTVKVKSYKENKIEKKKEEKEVKEEKDKNVEKEEGENEEEKNDEEEKKEEEIKEIANIKFIDEIINKLLNVKEIVKKGENIELYVEIPQTFEEETIKINSIIELESASGKKLELETNIILTTTPISALISCKEYKLIKQEINYDNDVAFEQCFKLDTSELLGDEEINFDLINYKNKDPIEFYLSVKSLENNTSNKPVFLQIKQKDKFKITIPKYDFTSNNFEIPRLNCILEIYINKNFIIYIIIDSLIRPNLNEVKMYDYYSRSYVENESIIYLNEASKEILKRENAKIELKFILYSTQDNSPFEVIPDSLNGFKITRFNGTIRNQKSIFSLF